MKKSLLFLFCFVSLQQLQAQEVEGEREATVEVAGVKEKPLEAFRCGLPSPKYWMTVKTTSAVDPVHGALQG